MEIDYKNKEVISEPRDIGKVDSSLEVVARGRWQY